MATKSKARAPAITTDAEYQARYDLDTLQRAREIKADKKRYEAAVALAKKQMLDNAAIAGGADDDADD